MTKRKIEIGVSGPGGALDRFERTWELARKGKARGTEVRLSFESLPLLLSNLTPARWAVLESPKRSARRSDMGHRNRRDAPCSMTTIGKKNLTARTGD